MRIRMPPSEILGLTDHRPWPLPDRPWIQRQSWLDFTFLHWRVDPAVIRRCVPEPLALDLRDGAAWVGVIPFRMAGVTLRGMPDIPYFSAFHELNVRTYVTWEGKPGVYFLSLDADNALAVFAARAWFGLPYRRAQQTSVAQGDHFAYRSRRTDGGPEARFAAEWTVGAPRAPDERERWLCERYALFVVDGGRVRRGDVHHAPWPIRDLNITIEENTMTAPWGFETPGAPDHAMFSPGVDTVLWNLSP